MKTYQSLKSDHQKELNNFNGIFFAFGKSQFKEGLKKVGAEEGEIASTGSGGYIRKDRVSAFTEMFQRHTEKMESSLKDETFLKEALVYELCNHEYCITGDVTDALGALCLSLEDIPETILREAKIEACKDY